MQNITEAQEILNSKTVKELRSIAREIHKAANDVTIPGYSKMVKAELVRQLSFEDAWYFVELTISLDETAAIEADTGTMEAIAEAESESDQRSDVVGGSVSAMIDQDAPNRTRFEAETGDGEINILRTAPGQAVADARFNGTVIGGTVSRDRNRWVLCDSVRKVRAGSLRKVAKLWAKKLEFQADAINIASLN